jgi:hypothetical protein
MAPRYMIAEEFDWRTSHFRADKVGESYLPALQIASIYRDLRKGLEDAKNAPGAADFYYGEMEMRRLANRRTRIPERHHRASSRAETALLYGYWAISGYGLRASRALATLAVVIVCAALLFTHPALASVNPPSPQITAIEPPTGIVKYAVVESPGAPTFLTALEFSARESISLLQPRAGAGITTTGAGTILDFALRLAGPVLLGFAILALRGRTKR